ncbi:MAG: DUF6458 family protein [Acidimicrobiales bacterium]
MRTGLGSGLVGSIVVFAVGAILYWGITTTQTHGFKLSTIGVILMVVGVVGLAITSIIAATSGTPRRRSFDRQAVDGSGRETVVHEELR